MRNFPRLTPYFVVLFAFAARMVAIDTTLIDGDRANPHGIGLLLAHQLAHGELSQLLLFSDNASVGLPNPPLMNYVWAAVSIFDKSLFAAVALGLMANTLVVALVFVVGRRCFGWTAGIIAATLTAGSNWAVYFARGTWHPSHLEVLVVAAAYLLALGRRDGKPKKLVAGFAVALLAGTGYFTGLFVLVQATLASVLADGWRPPLRRAWFTGLGVCIVGVLMLIVVLLATGRLTLTTARNLSVLQHSTEAANRVDPSARDPLGHFLRLATNRDYALSWTDAKFAGYAMREPVSQGLAIVLSVCIALGLGRMALNWREPVNRFWLVWAILPVIALLTLVAVKRDFEVAPYYLLLTSPVHYLAGGYGLASVLELLRTRLRPVITVSVCGVLAAVSAWNFSAAAESMRAQAFVIYDFMPLHWSMRLGRLWQHECTTLNGSNLWWDLSLFESPGHWRLGGTNSNSISSIWTVEQGGGTCALKQTGAGLPHSELLPLKLDDGSVIRTYRALPYAITQPPTMTVNLGWSLLQFDTPLTATAGTTITVQHAWRVDALPSEPYASWYFAPFIKLVAPDGRVVVDTNGAVALPGWQWQAGEVQASAVQVALPVTLPAGNYTLQSSLFDPNQRKNAVYFNSVQADQPILNLVRTITIY